LTYQACPSADGCSGDEFNANWYFPAKVDGVWQGEASSTAGGSVPTCVMAASEGRAELTDDGVLTMSLKNDESGQLTIKTDAECDVDSDFFKAQRPSFTCKSYEVLRAQKL
jgi:hypothetical protein